MVSQALWEVNREAVLPGSADRPAARRL